MLTGTVITAFWVIVEREVVGKSRVVLVVAGPARGAHGHVNRARLFRDQRAAVRASISVWSLRSAAPTGPIDKLPSAAPVTLRKLAVTTISAGSSPLPPRSPLNVATC